MSSHFLSIVIFGISSNIDCMAVGLSYGMKRKHIGAAASLIIGVISFMGTALSMLFGKSIALLLPPKLPNLLGGCIIFMIGAAGMLRSALGRDKEHAEQAVMLTQREAVVLGLALAVNNIGLGVGASITGMSVFPTALLALFLCLLFLYIGSKLGRLKGTQVLGRYVEPFANLLMIGLGIYEMLV
ncbi:MAG: manganese efflux pump [Eubacteriales bacterium]|nr:manganese efflux pump [Eubacteriales bacterium]